MKLAAATAKTQLKRLPTVDVGLFCSTSSAISKFLGLYPFSVVMPGGIPLKVNKFPRMILELAIVQGIFFFQISDGLTFPLSKHRSILFLSPTSALPAYQHLALSSFDDNVLGPALSSQYLLPSHCLDPKAEILLYLTLFSSHTVARHTLLGNGRYANNAA